VSEAEETPDRDRAHYDGRHQQAVALCGRLSGEVTSGPMQEVSTGNLANALEKRV